MNRTINIFLVTISFFMSIGVAFSQYYDNSSIKSQNNSSNYNLTNGTSNAPSNYVGFYCTINDYTGDLNNNEFGILRYKYYKPGAALAFEQYLNPFFNIKEQISYDWVQYESPAKLIGVDAQFLSADLIFKYKFNNDYVLREQAIIAPFIEFGGGGTYISSRQYINDKSGTGILNDTKFNLLAGLGLTFRLNENLNFEVASKVYMPMTDAWDGLIKGGNNIWANDIYVQQSMGLVFTIRKSANTNIDSDHDGVPDTRDDCPYTPRGVKVDKRGCPVVKNQYTPIYKSNNSYGDQDSDGDGVPNSRDKCANTPINTVVDAYGCPLNREDSYDKDSDGDGVPDSRDKCANTPLNTKVDENGCPINSVNNDDKDSDGDGVPDRIDRCPFSAGPASNKGCPEVAVETKRRLKFATRGIYFQTAKSVIKPESYPMLDEITDIINQYPDYNLRLSGHTDDVGSAEYNRILSQNRVDQVKAYLINKGIDANRLEAIGYGKQRPIANNNSVIGKALNRRVELELYLK